MLAALTVARDLDRRGVRIVVTTLDVDSSTPAGRMVFSALAQLAEFERATLTARGLHALTPLFWTHANPYGRLNLDMQTRVAALA